MRTIIANFVLGAAAMPLALVGSTLQVPAKDNTAAAIIGGLIAGAAVGAAVSGAVNHPKTVYVPVAAPPPPRPGWNASFSPYANIVCYPAQQACYNSAYGAYSATWTYRIFAR